MSELNNVAINSSGFVGIGSDMPTADKPSLESHKNNYSNKVSSMTPAEVEESVEEINHFLQGMKRNLSFSIDEDSGHSIIMVKDSESDEVIRQIPSEELMVLRKKMDYVVGILFDAKV